MYTLLYYPTKAMVSQLVQPLFLDQNRQVANMVDRMKFYVGIRECLLMMSDNSRLNCYDGFRGTLFYLVKDFPFNNQKGKLA